MSGVGGPVVSDEGPPRNLMGLAHAQRPSMPAAIDTQATFAYSPMHLPTGIQLVAATAPSHQNSAGAMPTPSGFDSRLLPLPASAPLASAPLASAALAGEIRSRSNFTFEQNPQPLPTRPRHFSPGQHDSASGLSSPLVSGGTAVSGSPHGSPHRRSHMSATKDAASAHPLEVRQACLRCWPKSFSTAERPEPSCIAAGHQPRLEFVTCVLWPPEALPAEARWVAVRPPPNGADFSHTQYLPCGYGAQCKYGAACTRAHSDPPEAEIAYWNWKQPLRGNARRRRGATERVARNDSRREGFLCHVCQVVMNSYSQLLQHLSGAKHKAQAEAQALTGDTAAPVSRVPADADAMPVALAGAELATLLDAVSLHEQSESLLGSRAQTTPDTWSKDDDGTAANALHNRLQRPSHSDRGVKETRTKEETEADHALLDAIVQGDIPAAQEAIDNGADVNVQRDGCPALHWAVYHQHVELALFLMSLGTSRDDTDRDQQTALHLVLHAGATNRNARLAILRSLLTQGWNPNAQDSQGRTPLHFCVDRNDLESAELLLKARANPHLSDAMGCSPMLLASLRMQNGSSAGGSRMHQLMSSWISSDGEQRSPSLPQSVSHGAGQSKDVSLSSGQSVSMKALEEVAPTFRPLFKALALFPYGASVELWRLSGLLKPIITRLNIKRKTYVLQAHEAGYVTIHQSDNQKQLYVRVAPQWRHVLQPAGAGEGDETPAVPTSTVEDQLRQNGSNDKHLARSHSVPSSPNVVRHVATMSTAAAAKIVPGTTAESMASAAPVSEASMLLAEATMGSSLPAKLTTDNPAASAPPSQSPSIAATEPLPTRMYLRQPTPAHPSETPGSESRAHQPGTTGFDQRRLQQTGSLGNQGAAHLPRGASSPLVGWYEPSMQHSAYYSATFPSASSENRQTSPNPTVHVSYPAQSSSRRGSFGNPGRSPLASPDVNRWGGVALNGPHASTGREPAPRSPLASPTVLAGVGSQYAPSPASMRRSRVAADSLSSPLNPSSQGPSFPPMMQPVQTMQPSLAPMHAGRSPRETYRGADYHHRADTRLADQGFAGASAAAASVTFVPPRHSGQLVTEEQIIAPLQPLPNQPSRSADPRPRGFPSSDGSAATASPAASAADHAWRNQHTAGKATMAEGSATPVALGGMFDHTNGAFSGGSLAAVRGQQDANGDDGTSFAEDGGWLSGLSSLWEASHAVPIASNDSQDHSELFSTSGAWHSPWPQQSTAGTHEQWSYSGDSGYRVDVHGSGGLLGQPSAYSAAEGNGVHTMQMEQQRSMEFGGQHSYAVYSEQSPATSSSNPTVQNHVQHLDKTSWNP